MNEILAMAINDMPQAQFACSCGRKHSFNVNALSIGKGAMEDLPKMAEPFKSGKILVVLIIIPMKSQGKKRLDC